MHLNRLNRMLVLLITLAVVLSACDKECFPSKVGGVRCDGNTLIFCPGGRMNFDGRHKKIDCSAKSQVCAAYDNSSSGYWCVDPLGTCNSKTFTPYCYVAPADAPNGHQVKCKDGKQIATGPWCEKK